MKFLSQPHLSITDYDVERMIQETGAETGAKAGRAPLELCPELGDVYNHYVDIYDRSWEPAHL
jgi:hypothetical protein